MLLALPLSVQVDVVLEPGQDPTVSRAHLAAMRAAAGGAVMKVILETPLRDDDNLAAACRTCCELGVDVLKTCTGKRGSAGACSLALSHTDSHLPMAFLPVCAWGCVVACPVPGL